MVKIGHIIAVPVIVVFLLVLVHLGHDAKVSSLRLAFASRPDDPNGCVSALADQIREDLSPWETHGITVPPDNNNLCKIGNDGLPCE